MNVLDVATSDPAFPIHVPLMDFCDTDVNKISIRSRDHCIHDQDTSRGIPFLDIRESPAIQVL
jgi:hypothetical protein